MSQDAGRPSRVSPEDRTVAGHAADVSDRSRGIPRTVVFFDGPGRKFGRLTVGQPEEVGFGIASTAEMSAFFIGRPSHDAVEIEKFEGACADFEPDISGRDDAFIAMFILANGDDLPAATLTLLREWGLSAVIGASEVVSFVGHNSLDPRLSFEARTSLAEDHVAAVTLVGSHMAMANGYAYGEITGYWRHILLMGG